MSERVNNERISNAKLYKVFPSPTQDSIFVDSADVDREAELETMTMMMFRIAAMTVVTEPSRANRSNTSSVSPLKGTFWAFTRCYRAPKKSPSSWKLKLSLVLLESITNHPQFNNIHLSINCLAKVFLFGKMFVPPVKMNCSRLFYKKETKLISNECYYFDESEFALLQAPKHLYWWVDLHRLSFP